MRCTARDGPRPNSPERYLGVGGLHGLGVPGITTTTAAAWLRRLSRTIRTSKSPGDLGPLRYTPLPVHGIDPDLDGLHLERHPQGRCADAEERVDPARGADLSMSWSHLVGVAGQRNIGERRGRADRLLDEIGSSPEMCKVFQGESRDDREA